MAASRSASCISTTSCAPGSRKRQSSSASSRRGKSPNRRLYPALELPQRHLPDHQHAGRAVVEAGYRREILTPYFLNRRAFSIAISSSVSRQSAEKPGVTTARFFTPSLASFLRVRLVEGSSHLPRPNRD